MTDDLADAHKLRAILDLPAHEQRLIFGGRAHSKLLSAEAVLTLLSKGFMFDLNPLERLGVISNLQDLVRAPREAVAKLNELYADDAGVPRSE
jgi:hypothetical protein